MSEISLTGIIAPPYGEKNKIIPHGEKKQNLTKI